MDTTDASPSRRKAGIDLLVRGGFPLSEQGVLIAHEYDQLVINSFSDCIHGENVTRAEAVEKIEHSRRVLEEVESLSPEFVAAFAGAPREFRFLHGTDSGSVLMAVARRDGLEWLG